MKSHRKHKPLLPTEREVVVKKRNTTSESKKVRLDRLLAAEASYWFWFEIEESAKASAANCTLKNHEYLDRNGRVLGKCWHGLGEGWCLKQARRKYEALWIKAREDGII